MSEMPVSDPNLPDPPLFCNDEDYTDSVCLLLPGGQATLIDTVHFEWASGETWLVLGTNIFVADTGSMLVLSRWVVEKELRKIDPWNTWNRMRKRQVDHINRNRWDNRASNLRLATSSQNAMNKPPKAGGTSKYKGVTKQKGRWVATCNYGGKLKRLGSYEHELHAAIAYNRYVAKVCPDFAYLNPITASPGDPPVPPFKRSYRRRRTKPKA